MAENLEEDLRHLITAISEPTRAAILDELGHAGELTATQLARRLDLTPNNVYHHIRVLRGLGLLDEPRVVPGNTYVEKYYRVTPHIAVATNDPDWADRTQATMAPAERQALIVGLCLRMAQILRRAALRYQAMDADVFDREIRQRGLILASINDASGARLEHRLRKWRELVKEEQREFTEQPGAPATATLLMAGLPLLWDAPTRAEPGE